MKIILINPSQHSAYGKFMDIPVFFPIGLGYIGAVLEKQGHAVDICDIDSQNVTHAELTDMLVKMNYDLVGISSTSPTINSAFRLAEFIKSKIDTRIVFGGAHPTLFPEHIFESKNVDFVVRGEGEETILELVNAIERGGNFANISGLSFRHNGKVIHNTARPPIANLDELPFPMTHKLNSDRYMFANALMKKVAPIIASRGCPGRCTFCCTKKIFGTKMRQRSARNVLDEMIWLKENLGVQEIHIWDDNFISSKKFIIELRDLIKRENLSVKISLMNGVRVDFFTEEIAGYLKEMGVYSVGFGIESGDQKVLDRIRKGIKLETCVKAMAVAKKFNFNTWGFFMLGLPGDNEETVEATIKISIKLDPDIAKFHVLKPFPGTEIHEELKNKNLLLSHDFDRYSIHSPPVHRLPDLSENDLIRLQKRAYRMFYFRPRKLLKQLLNLKTPERAKANVKAALNVFKMIRR